MHGVIRKTRWLLSHRAAPRSLGLHCGPAYLFKALHCYSSLPPIPVHFPILLPSCPPSGRNVLESIHNSMSVVGLVQVAGMLASMVGNEGATAAPLFQDFICLLVPYVHPKRCNWSRVSCSITLKWHIWDGSARWVCCKHPFWKSGICICFGCSTLENEK